MMHINGIKTRPPCNLVLASANRPRFARWHEMLSEIASLSLADTLDMLKDSLSQLKPEIMLLDYDLPGLNGIGEISRLKKSYPGTHIVILDDPASDEDEVAMLKAGARGICPPDINESSLKLMVNSIRNGELWIRRSLTSRLLEHLREHAHPQTDTDSVDSRLKDLTRREYEIALRVGNGESNKQIAHALDISERTVKAHLTNVFQKTGATDRLKMALILSGDSR